MLSIKKSGVPWRCGRGSATAAPVPATGSGSRCVADGVATAAGVPGRLIGERVCEHGHTVTAAAHDQFSIGQRVCKQVVICDKILEVGPRFGDTVIGTGELDVGSRQSNSFDDDESQNIFIVCSAAISLLRLHPS